MNEVDLGVRFITAMEGQLDPDTPEGERDDAITFLLHRMIVRGEARIELFGRLAGNLLGSIEHPAVAGYLGALTVAMEYGWRLYRRREMWKPPALEDAWLADADRAFTALEEALALVRETSLWMASKGRAN